MTRNLSIASWAALIFTVLVVAIALIERVGVDGIFLDINNTGDQKVLALIATTNDSNGIFTREASANKLLIDASKNWLVTDALANGSSCDSGSAATALGVTGSLTCSPFGTGSGSDLTLVGSSTLLTVSGSEITVLDDWDAAGSLDVTGTSTFDGTVNLSADSVNTITEIAAALKSGSDGTLITGTAGTNADLSQWNGDGDLVDGPTPPSGTIVGTSDTQTLTNKSIDSSNNTITNIVNVDIGAAAAIAYSKLAALTDGNLLVGNGSNVATSVNPSGDIDISNSGVFSINSGVIEDGDVSGTAEIAVSKLADGSARQLLQTDSGGTGVEFTDNISVPGTLNSVGNGTFEGTLAVTGAANVNGLFTVHDNAIINGTLTVAGAVQTTLTGPLSIAHVNGTNNFESLLINHDANSGGGFFIQKTGSDKFIALTGFELGGGDKVLFYGAGGWGVHDVNEHRFFTDPNDPTTGINGGLRRMTINKDGNVAIGTEAFPSTGTEGLIFGDDIALSSMGTDTAAIFADDDAGTVAIHLIDEAGTITQGTSHNFSLFTPDPAEPMPWSFYSRNPYLGIETNVDIAKLARLMEQLTAGTLDISGANPQQIIYNQNLPAEDILEWMDTQKTNAARRQIGYERWEFERDSFEPTDDFPMFAGIAPGLPIVKRPPTWLLDRLITQGRWSAPQFNTERANSNAWRALRGLPPQAQRP